MNQHQITMTRGDTRTLTLTLTNAEGDAYDLTGADVWFQAGDLVAKSLGDGITVSSPATGVASILISSADTEDAPDCRMAYPYNVQLELADGSTVTPVRGLLVIVPDVPID